MCCVRIGMMLLGAVSRTSWAAKYSESQDRNTRAPLNVSPKFPQLLPPRLPMDGSSSTPTRQSPETESPVYVATPRTGSDDSDRRDRDVHTIRGNKDEGGYKLRPLRVKGADYGDDIEGGQLLGEKSDDENERDEVLYAIKGPEDDVELRSPVLRSLRRRTEFLYTCQEEKAVVRKLDKYLVGGLAVLYMLRWESRSGYSSKEMLTGMGLLAF